MVKKKTMAVNRLLIARPSHWKWKSNFVGYGRSAECFLQYCNFCQTNVVGYPAMGTENEHTVHTICSTHYIYTGILVRVV